LVVEISNFGDVDAEIARFAGGWEVVKILRED
jgi:hypothetical protein